MSEKFYEYGAAEVIGRGMVGFERVRKDKGHLRQISATANLDPALVEDWCILSFMCSEERVHAAFISSFWVLILLDSSTAKLKHSWISLSGREKATQTLAMP